MNRDMYKIKEVKDTYPQAEFVPFKYNESEPKTKTGSIPNNVGYPSSKK